MRVARVHARARALAHAAIWYFFKLARIEISGLNVYQWFRTRAILQCPEIILFVTLGLLLLTSSG